MGLQIWDRNTGNLIAEFDDQAHALAFLRRQVDGLARREAELEVERMALLHVGADGAVARKIAEGHRVLDLLVASTT